MLDSAKVRALAEDIQNALKEVGDKHGVQIETGRGTYNSSSLKIQLHCNVGDSKTEAEKTQFNIFAPRFGFKPEDYKRSFTVDNKTYQLVGFAPRSRKYQLVGRAKNGTEYRFTRSVIANA